MSNTYHVARFDHERAARTLFDDLNTLKVARVTLFTEPRDGKSDSGAVYVHVPEGVDPDEHMTAVKNFSLGRGSHTVTREDIPSWTSDHQVERAARLAERKSLNL